MAIIAGASHAAKYKETHPRADEAEVVRYVTKEVNSILEQIDEDIN